MLKENPDYILQCLWDSYNDSSHSLVSANFFSRYDHAGEKS